METRTHVLSDPERFHGRDSSRRAIRSNASESDISLPVYHLTGWSPGPRLGELFALDYDLLLYDGTSTYFQKRWAEIQRR